MLLIGGTTHILTVRLRKNLPFLNNFVNCPSWSFGHSLAILGILISWILSKVLTGTNS